MEKHFMKSGSANIYFVYQDKDITKVRKTYFRKPKEKLDREVNALTKLEHNDHFPKIVSIMPDIFSFYMTYCGPRLTQDNLPVDWREQVETILLSMEKQNIVNGDIDIKNLTVLDGKIYLLDFGNIRLKGEDFFKKHDYETYKLKQHHKLFLICDAFDNNQPVEQILKNYNNKVSHYFK